MSTYAIGDIQGCFASLQALLDRIRFDPQTDRVWLVGDLVNRGPRSLEVLRWARGLGERAVAVLGNHDLHLLGVAAGVRKLKGRDTFGDVLGAPDREELLAWLRGRPLLHREGGHLLLHAGLLPGWTWAEAERRAQAAQEALGREPRLLGPRPPPELPRALAEVPLTLLSLLTARCVTRGGALVEDFSGPWRQRPPGTYPWFDHPRRPPREGTVVFGHWAALGLVIRPDILALDSACVWGGDLTAVRLEDRAVYLQPSLERGAAAG